METTQLHVIKQLIKILDPDVLPQVSALLDRNPFDQAAFESLNAVLSNAPQEPFISCILGYLKTHIIKGGENVV